MSFLRYFFKSGKLFIYAGISAVISLLMAEILQSYRDIALYFRLFLTVLPILLILRIADDVSDYEKDSQTKEQPLRKSQLRLTLAAAMIVFVLLNLCFYQLAGLGSLCVLAYILLQQKAEILKLFFMPLASSYYFYVNQTSGMSLYMIAGYLGVCVGASALFYWFKRRRSR